MDDEEGHMKSMTKSNINKENVAKTDEKLETRRNKIHAKQLHFIIYFFGAGLAAAAGLAAGLPAAGFFAEAGLAVFLAATAS